MKTAALQGVGQERLAAGHSGFRDFLVPSGLLHGEAHQCVPARRRVAVEAAIDDGGLSGRKCENETAEVLQLVWSPIYPVVRASFT
jgi:hypothetical protein